MSEEKPSTAQMLALSGGISAGGLSIISLSLYGLRTAVLSEWLLKHYFMLTFSIAGFFFGLVFTMLGFMLAGDTIGIEGDEE